MTDYPVYIGWSPEELIAATVAEESIRRTMQTPTDAYFLIRRLSRHTLGEAYTRVTIRKDQHRRWDVISQAPMSTDHAIARFFIPWLCDYRGYALFTDGDILCRENLWPLFAQAMADPGKAVWCVQHPPLLLEGFKKDGETQQRYTRKNWSSVMLFHCGHPANTALTLEMVNRIPGRDLHRFCWLQDSELGALDPKWNVLVNISDVANPGIVHFTEGVPLIEGHQGDAYADEWFEMATCAGFRLPAPVATLD